MFADVFREFIVQFRQLFFFDLVYQAVEDGFLAGKIFCVVFLRERYGNVSLFARRRADELFFESRNEHAGSEGQFLSFGCAAFKLVVAYKTGIVQQHGIAVLCRSFYQYHAGVPLLQSLEFVLYVFLLDFLRSLFDLHALVVLHFDDREARDRDRDREALAFRDLAEFRSRRVDHFQIQFF